MGTPSTIGTSQGAVTPKDVCQTDQDRNEAILDRMVMNAQPTRVAPFSVIPMFVEFVAIPEVPKPSELSESSAIGATRLSNRDLKTIESQVESKTALKNASMLIDERYLLGKDFFGQAFK